MTTARRTTAATAVFLAATLGGTQTASAGSAYGQYGYYGPYLGYSYRNQAGIHTNSSDAWASTWVESLSGNVPTGYMGAMARMYKSGVLCRVADYIYNSSTSSGMSQLVFGPCGRGTYSSQGVTKAWNGSSYNAVWTYASPNQNF